MIAALVGLIRLDDWLPTIRPQSNGLIIFGLLLAPFIGLGSAELHRLLRSADCEPLWLWPALSGMILAAVPFAARNGLIPGAPADLSTDLRYTIVVLTIAVIGTLLLVGARRRTDGAIRAIGASLFSICYLGLLVSFALRIRLWAPSGGAWLLLYFLATVKLCDMGAYFTGRFLGKHKLVEWLSPKKTIEGLVGGVAASVVFAVAVPVLVRRFGTGELGDVFPMLGMSVAFGLAMAVLGTAGDLLESLIKRDAGVKDSAAAVPAFGGMLDILDSLLLAAPVGFWMLV